MTKEDGKQFIFILLFASFPFFAQTKQLLSARELEQTSAGCSAPNGRKVFLNGLFEQRSAKKGQHLKSISIPPVAESEFARLALEALYEEMGYSLVDLASIYSCHDNDEEEDNKSNGSNNVISIHDEDDSFL